MTPANLPISLLFGVNAEAAAHKKSEEHKEQAVAAAAQRKGAFIARHTHTRHTVCCSKGKQSSKLGLHLQLKERGWARGAP